MEEEVEGQGEKETCPKSQGGVDLSQDASKALIVCLGLTFIWLVSIYLLSIYYVPGTAECQQEDTTPVPSFKKLAIYPKEGGN